MPTPESDDFDWTFGFSGPADETVPAHPVTIRQNRFGQRFTVDAKIADADNRQHEAYAAKRRRRQNTKRRVK